MRVIDLARRRRDSSNPQFILLENGVTVRYLGSTAGETGYINNDPVTYPTLYTAYDQTMWDAVTSANYDDSIDFTAVCTTLVTSMGSAFSGNIEVISFPFPSYELFPSNFNQNIAHFDMSNVTSIAGMFILNESFNQDISFWDVSSVTDMSETFRVNQGFNQDISNWDVSNVTNMQAMFSSENEAGQDSFTLLCVFNQDLSNWCVEQIPSEPIAFKDSSTNWVLPKPNWGDPC